MRTHRPSLIAAAIVVARLLAHAAQGPQFEVASVKPSHLDRPGRFQIQPGGRLAAANQTAALLIQRAYGLQPYNIDGLPAWANRDRFDVQAKAMEREAAYSSSDVLAMLRHLLAERFGLTAHAEIRVRPVFLLVRERPDRPLSPALRPSLIDCTGRRAADTGLPAGECGLFARQSQNAISVAYRGRTLAEFGHDLVPRVGRPVLDRTNTAGQFDIEITSERGQDIYTPLREQLGLRLVGDDAPVEMFIVDGIRPPEPD